MRIRTWFVIGVLLGAGAVLVPPAGAQVATISVSNDAPACGPDGSVEIPWTVVNQSSGGGPSFSLSATASPGGPVSFSPSTIAPGEVADGLTVLPRGTVGPVTITVTGTQVPGPGTDTAQATANIDFTCESGLEALLNAQCAADGNLEVTYGLVNGTGGPITVVSAQSTPGGPVPLGPAVPAATVASAQLALPGSTSGPITLRVVADIDGFTETVEATVSAEGGCAAAAVAVAPRFTG